MRLFKIKLFAKWAKKQGISDDDLMSAISEIEAGQVEANLGGNLFKKRIATKGRGKSSSTRTIVAFKTGHRAFFVYGFEKGQRSNITAKEEKALKIFGNTLLAWTDKEISQRLEQKELIEVTEEK